eukprot:TRINITY_DN2281_c0_g1_i1.p1 TRINITY_DN2281_c0_g1~~TRINITY_DN2281_c0_g1_i1.p1  ORF type:complete len:136 (-),score=5.82 TRINITY_DN2281_c0_g1_i1:717-1124(-)
MAISQRGGKSLKMNVRVLSEEVVRPRAPAPDHPKLLELCVIDQVQPRFHGPPMLAFLGPMPDELPFEEFVQRSKEAWARTLVAYYTLAGRLVVSPEKASLSLLLFTFMPDEVVKIGTLRPEKMVLCGAKAIITRE